MLALEVVDTRRSGDRRRFVDLPFRLHRGNPSWVPPMRADVELMLDRDRHPLYEKADACFLLAVRDGRVVGRLAVVENRAYNEYHRTRCAFFSLLELEEDAEAASALFERAFSWARERGLTRILGPRGFGAFDGYGLLVQGFERRQTMTMSAWNPPFHRGLVEAQGFRKEVDFVSYTIEASAFVLPERVRHVAERVRQRGILRVKDFRSRSELRAWVGRVGEAYNRAFVDNWEYYPLGARELSVVAESMLLLAQPRLLKLILHGEEVVGFLLAFPDVSAGLQRARGRLLPFGLLHLLLDLRRTRCLTLNGVGILPRFQGRGGNALLYAEIEETVKRGGRFRDVELTQIADTAALMTEDMRSLGVSVRKVHRVFSREV